MSDDLLWLRAEVSTLRRLIDDTPADAVIDRGSLEARLRKVEAEIAAVERNALTWLETR